MWLHASFPYLKIHPPSRVYGIFYHLNNATSCLNYHDYTSSTRILLSDVHVLALKWLVSMETLMDPCAALLLIISFYLFTSILITRTNKESQPGNTGYNRMTFKQKYEAGTRTTYELLLNVILFEHSEARSHSDMTREWTESHISPIHAGFGSNR